jgi:hypothetical protein
VQLASLDQGVTLVRRVWLDPRVLRAPLARQDLKASLEHKELPAQLDRQVLADQLDHLDHRVTQDLLAFREIPVELEGQVLLVSYKVFVFFNSTMKMHLNDSK